MSNELTPLSFAVLAIVGDEGASAYEIVQVAERVQRLYWAGAASKLYAEPKRLERLGYLISEPRQGKRRQRPHYTLTERGRTALEDWLGSPSTFSRIQSEAALRVFAQSLAPDGRVLDSLRAMREDISALTSAIDSRDAAPAAFPDRQEEVALMRSLARRLLRAHLEWVEEVEATLGDGYAT
jgi:PadR family transcriptional regulator, regulatory protein AphA